jgi:uncharacterized protein (TIGR00725 family)
MATGRLPIVGVMGSSTEQHAALAQEVGRLLARLGVHLLNGGGQGVMAAVSQAFAESEDRRGLVIGIVPCQEDDPGRPKEGYPNRWIEVPIYTHLPRSSTHGTDPMSRNHINVLSSDLIIALPGGPGTASECALAVHYRKPIIAYLSDGGSIPELPLQVPVARTLEQVEQFLQEHLRLGERGASSP